MCIAASLALALRKELDRCLEQAGQRLEWADLKALRRVAIEESGKCFACPSQSQAVCGRENHRLPTNLKLKAAVAAAAPRVPGLPERL